LKHLTFAALPVGVGVSAAFCLGAAALLVNAGPAPVVDSDPLIAMPAAELANTGPDVRGYAARTDDPGAARYLRITRHRDSCETHAKRTKDQQR
jgi:hypothetical protein